jgi:hypothetical protein
MSSQWFKRGFGRLEASLRGKTELCDWWTNGDMRVIDGCEGERREGCVERRFSAKRVPALWDMMLMCGMPRWRRRRGMVSRKMGMRSLRGTGVEPPKPGLGGISFGERMRMRKRGPRDKVIRKIVTIDSSIFGEE